MEANKMFEELQQILLKEDRVVQDAVMKDVELLKQQLLDKDNFKKKVDPLFEEHVRYLQQKFPDLFGPFLARAIQMQMTDSQDEMVTVLKPVIRKAIVRSIRDEISVISQKIDTNVKTTFSFKNIGLRIKALVTGVRYEDLLLQDATRASLEEVFLIDKQSGLLIGHCSFSNLVDADIIAGMLTGIKSFVEHAFSVGEQELETLEYEKYKILVQNYASFYIAFVVNGNIDITFKVEVEKSVTEFVRKTRVKGGVDITKELFVDMSKKLEEHFHGYNKVDK